MIGLVRRIDQAVTFARHMPLRKLVRRMELEAARRLALRAPPSLRGAPLALRATPPTPLMPARRDLLSRTDVGWRFHFLRQTVESGLEPDWALDPGGASAQLWRMNLHYMEYLEDVPDSAFMALVESWIRANPPFKAGFWWDSWNSYTLSIRVVVWMQQIAARSGLGERQIAAANDSLAVQLRFLARFLETDIGGNHLIKNIKALIWASRFFEGAEAEGWGRLGLRLLRRELPRQVLTDGVHDERSASYLAQVFADLLEIRHALGADPLGGALDAGLARMAQALADLSHPDGRPALFNDSGLTMAYAPGDCLAAFAHVYGAAPQPRAVFAFPAAGYFGMRAENLYLVADCGAIAPDDLPAHGHGDVLSFELSAFGMRFIVDQGVFEYSAGAKRQQSRSAQSHNTLCFEGGDQAEFFSAFRVGRRPKVEVLHYEARSEGFMLEGTHDGFARLPGAPQHKRRFNADPQGLVIEDTVSGSSLRPASIGFLLHPEVTLEAIEGGWLLTRAGRSMEIVADAPLLAEPAVWWPDMGVETPTTRLRATVPAGAHADFRRTTTRARLARHHA